MSRAPRWPRGRRPSAVPARPAPGVGVAVPPLHELHRREPAFTGEHWALYHAIATDPHAAELAGLARQLGGRLWCWMSLRRGVEPHHVPRTHTSVDMGDGVRMRIVAVGHYRRERRGWVVLN